ncbi:HEPN domain-containing protein, partial [Planctomycetota bacterium]
MIEEVRLHFDRSEQCLDDAQFLQEGQRFSASVGRSYYAMFHAAKAILLDKGIERNSHQGIISAFGEFLSKPGLVESKYHQYLREAFDLRQESDYHTIVNVSN